MLINISLTPKTKTLADNARRDKEFLEEMEKTTPDEDLLEMSEDARGKLLIAATYYGWLVAKGKWSVSFLNKPAR